ncbi:hypothetical protein OLMES_0207 [Oleiphilus messinensis]|uniref:Uncharacterized protein n=1 Tax=Oleiphilus messinensis TaxID=141451 RepID=A0A1Y0I4D1_9GAMM|nr:hypothetical protein [Oleiphilus messinensis]ARU54314.1 hypothetical protein OLMES_0207 [Oleiphilus messinensis]
MAELLMCTRADSPSNLLAENKDLLKSFCATNSLRNTSLLQPYTPYLIPSNFFNRTSIISPLSELSRNERQLLTHTIQQFGDLTVAISDFYNDMFLGGKKADWQSASGAALGAYNDRVSAFTRSLNRYQETLIALRKAKLAKEPKLTLANLEVQVRSAYGNLNQHFQREMVQYTKNISSKRGSVLSNVDRGVNIAKDSRHVTKLQLSSTQQMQNLSRFSKGLSYVGKSIVVLDAAGRSGNVVKDYREGNDWQKTAVQESVSMSAGVIAGSIVSKATVAGLTILLGTTPVGWAIAISAGLAAGFLAGYTMSEVGKDIATQLYDWSSSIDWFD